MRVQFLLGPAGSGKTWRCLDDIRDELKRAPDGPPILLLSPKQATFQLERQLLDDPKLAGYSRLQIVSFDRLARWLLETFSTVPELLDDEGRVMVLRALLVREQPNLRVFRATARLPGFARQLSQLLREFQRHQLTLARLAHLAENCSESAPLRDKLHDLHHLLRAYYEWLEQSQTQDADQLLDIATELLRGSSPTATDCPIRISGLWLDAFAEMTPQELDLLCAILPFCRTATLAFCLDPQTSDSQSWLSLWSTVRRTYLDCRQRIRALPDCEVVETRLARTECHSRFRDAPTLALLEAHWIVPAISSPPFPPGENSAVMGQTSGVREINQSSTANPPHSPLRLAVCANPEDEAVLAAREILRHVREGGRFRDCAVILRTLDHHHTALRRAFRRYGIPFFLDRREMVTHHPLAELTRFALRTLAYAWQPDDFFGALKSGLVHDRDEDIDWLENLALANGWRGAHWLEPLAVPEPKFNLPRAEQLRVHLTAPFRKLGEQLRAASSVEEPGVRCLTMPLQAGTQFSGASLAIALRDLWEDLAIESRLAAWDDALALVSASPHLAPPLHAAVLRQMHAWLDNLERAFPDSALHLPFREWLPILEAGLSSLSVGVIPPALDQVLIGTIDRSRNPELQLALVLGLNEGIFPALPPPPVLLTDTERDILAAHDTRLGLDPRAQIAHERYFAYIACTRSRARLVLTCAAADTDGKQLHPSPILAHIQQLFPDLKLEKIQTTYDWRKADHTEELVEPILRELAVAVFPTAAVLNSDSGKSLPENSENSPCSTTHSSLLALSSLPAIAPIISRFRELAAARATTTLSQRAVNQLYGSELRTSVSKLEQFAECPFKFFIAAGLGAEERREFEVDHRARGSFIHRLLDEFHLSLTASGRHWRDLSPADAETLAARVGENLLGSPEFALFVADESRRFAARTLIASAQRLLRALVGWMPSYTFDPVAVELGFGLPDSPLPAWQLGLANGCTLSLRGRIDRVDLCRGTKSDETLAVVVDYKSSEKKLDRLKIEHGLQLQLLAYLNVLRTPGAAAHSAFGDSHPVLVPAGVFYVPLHGTASSTGNRAEILGEDEAARRTTYEHAGRFDFVHRASLDTRPGGQSSGQFRLRLNKEGGVITRGSDSLPTTEFTELLAQVEANLLRLGNSIFAGEAQVDPVRLSASEKVCDRCDYRPICRFDPWRQSYRPLLKPAAKEEKA